MPICSGHGGSVIQPGLGTFTIITASAIEAVLAKFNKNLAELLGPLLAGAAYDLTTICASDPPSDPGLTLTDVGDALNFYDPSVNLPALAKVQQWFLHQYWYTVCQCSDGTQPALSTPSDPGDPGSTTGGLPTGTVGQSCWDVTYSESFPPDSVPYIITADLVPYSVTGSVPSGDRSYPQQTTAAAIPSGAVTVRITTKINASPTNFTQGGNVYFWQSNFTPISAPGTSNFTIGGATTDDRTITIPSGAAWWLFDYSQDDTGISHGISGEVIIVCSGQSGTGINQPCCPPDPNLTAKLDQILGLLTSLYQAPTAPGSYADATVHAALSGSGSFAVSGLTLAIKLTVTTLPIVYGVDAGSPNFYFNLGYVTFETDAAPFANQRVEFETQFFLAPSLATTCHYTFPPGMVATITEVYAGP